MEEASATQQTAIREIGVSAFQSIPNLEGILQIITKFERKLNENFGEHRSTLRIQECIEEQHHYIRMGDTSEYCAVIGLSRQYEYLDKGPYYFNLQAKLIRMVRKLYKTCKVHQQQIYYKQQAESTLTVHFDSRYRFQRILIPAGRRDTRPIVVEIKKFIDWYQEKVLKTFRSIIRLDDTLETLREEWSMIQDDLITLDGLIRRKVRLIDRLICRGRFVARDNRNRKLKIKTLKEFIKGNRHTLTPPFYRGKYIWIMDTYTDLTVWLEEYLEENTPFQDKESIMLCIHTVETGIEKLKLLSPMLEKMEDYLKHIIDEKCG